MEKLKLLWEAIIGTLNLFAFIVGIFTSLFALIYGFLIIAIIFVGLMIYLCYHFHDKWVSRFVIGFVGLSYLSYLLSGFSSIAKVLKADILATVNYTVISGYLGVGAIVFGIALICRIVKISDIF